MKDDQNTNIKDIIEDYKNGISQHNIYLKYGINFQKIRNILKINKIKRRGRKKHSLNESFFENIDDFYKSYFLGLIEADGSILKTRPRDLHVGKFNLSLQERDGYLVTKLAEKIKIDKSPKLIYRDKTRQNQISLSFANKRFCQYLFSLGCSDKKSFTLKFPNKIPNNLVFAFILGYFDGDGSLVVHKNLRKGNFSIISSVKFVKECHEILSRCCDVGGNIELRKCKNGTIGTVKYCGNIQILNIFHFLYRNSPFFLKRKYEKFLELIRLNPEKYINYLCSLDKYWGKLWKEI